MPAELQPEVEHLLLDLVVAEAGIVRAREVLQRRQIEIAKPVVDRLSKVERTRAVVDEAGQEIAALRRGKYRSELAHLAAEIVTAERHRARTLQKLDAFPQFGELPKVGEIGVTFDNERTFTITAGGKPHQFKVPFMLDRGVWSETRGYEIGDAVTYDGSLWIAREHLPQHEPGKGPGWRLAVVKGRNGRDAQSIRTARGKQ